MPVTPVRIRLGVRETETETEKTMDAVTFVAPVIDNVPTLPYAWLWEAWSQHVQECSQCAFVVHETEDQAVDALCWTGQGMNHGITAKIRRTRELAALN